MALHGSVDVGVLCRVCDAGAMRSFAFSFNHMEGVPYYIGNV
jgi:hypothetical protein